MPKTTSMYIRIDPTVKADVEAIYSQYGMSITDAINIFLYTSRNIGGLPFDLRPSQPTNIVPASISSVGTVSSENFSAFNINTDNISFNREEANERR